MFDGINVDSGEVTNPTEVLNKLLTPEDIDGKTDVQINHIRYLVIMKWYELRFTQPKVLPIIHLAECMEYYKQLMVSLDRKSRIEITGAVSRIGLTVPEEETLGGKVKL